MQRLRVEVFPRVLLAVVLHIIPKTMCEGTTVCFVFVQGQVTQYPIIGQSLSLLTHI